MKVIVKDHIIDTSLIKDIQIWGEYYYNTVDDDLDEIGVFIEYYKDRLVKKDNDLIIVGLSSDDIESNKKNVEEARRIFEFLESHRTKLDYPTFD